MRIWSLHPQQLDRIGLVAGWREALLAQAVLSGQTTGYRHHPQLERFRQHPEPLDVISAYLSELQRDATRRGYRFNEQKILRPLARPEQIAVTTGQLEYEWQHLGVKLQQRSQPDHERWRQSTPQPHPLFSVVEGPLESWERA